MDMLRSCGYSADLGAELRTERMKLLEEVIASHSNTVCYEDFGAVGDGVCDDSEAIRAAHTFANERGYAVVARRGAKYRVGAVTKPIKVTTDTDFNGSTIIFDDSAILPTDKAREVHVFNIAPSVNSYSIPVAEGCSFKRGQANINIMFDESVMLKIEDSSDKIYMRYGENANNGVNKNDMIIVDKEGNVDPSTPIQYDFDNVSTITVYSINEKKLYFGNGKIETLAHNPKAYDPDYENHYCYYARGIQVTRSNVLLVGIEHRVFGEDLTVPIDRNGDGEIDIYGADKSYGVPYVGTFNFKSCYNVTMADCLVQGHQAYSFYQGKTRYDKGNIRNEMGSYDINALDCVNLTLENIVQYENSENDELITNRVMYHGIMGSNFCRNIALNNCYLDRFDSHQGVHNATVKNCTLGFGILVIGGGDLIIENVYRISGYSFVHLRMDYNSVFDGDVLIRDCRAGSNIETLIHARWYKFYNGLANHITNKLTVDGLISESEKLTCYDIGNLVPEALTDDVNRIYLPKKIVVSDVTKADGITPQNISASVQNEIFDVAGVSLEYLK